MAEIVSLQSAVAELVSDGDVVALEGFTHLIPHAAGHELIRQGRRDLTLIRMTPDVVYDQLIGARAAQEAHVLVGREPRRRLALPAPRRGRERVARRARARGALTRGHGGGLLRPAPPNLPFGMLRGYADNDLDRTHDGPADHLPIYRRGARGGACAPARRRHRPRAAGRPEGNVQLWGITGVQKEVVLASARSIVTVEEVVDELEARAGAIVLPSWAIDAVAPAPRGAHPSYAHGYYERDNDFYVRWAEVSRDREAFTAWIDRHVRGTKDVEEYHRVLAEDGVAA